MSSPAATGPPHTPAAHLCSIRLGSTLIPMHGCSDDSNSVAKLSRVIAMMHSPACPATERELHKAFGLNYSAKTTCEMADYCTGVGATGASRQIGIRKVRFKVRFGAAQYAAFVVAAASSSCCSGTNGSCCSLHTPQGALWRVCAVNGHIGAVTATVPRKADNAAGCCCCCY
eukprot:5711-Heterococcus_DN1.PRE.4